MAAYNGYEFYLQYRAEICGGEDYIAGLWLIYSLDGGDTYYEVEIPNLVAPGQDCPDYDINYNSATVNFDGINVIISVDPRIQAFIPLSLIESGNIELYVVTALGDSEFEVFDTDSYFKTNVTVGSNGTIVRVSNLYDVFEFETGIADNLYSVDLLDENHFVAGGENGVVFVGEGDSITQVAISISGVPIVNDIWNVEYIAPNVFIAADSTTIYLSPNNGVTWQTVKTFNNEYIADIVMITQSIGYLITNSPITELPKVYRTLDGGFNWKNIQLSTDIPSGIILTKINAHINDENLFVASGYTPDLYPALPADPTNIYGNTSGPSPTETGYIIKSFEL